MARRFQIAGGFAGFAALALVWLAWSSWTRADSPAALPTASASRAEELDEPPDLRPAPSESPPTRLVPPAAVPHTIAEPQPAAERQPVEVPAPISPTLRGQVVDARTGQGLPFVELKPYTFAKPSGSSATAVSDLEGRFEIALQREQNRLRGKDLLTGRSDVRWREDVRQDLVWRLEIGPTLIVRPRGAPSEPRQWRVRLVQRPGEADERAWPWQNPQVVDDDGTLLVARYETYETEPTRGARIRVQVDEAGSIWKGEREIEFEPGVSSVEVDVEPHAATVSGRVLDGDGQPVRAAVTALRRGVRRSAHQKWLQTYTDEEGGWRLEGVEPGPTRILVATDRWPVQSAELELARGDRKTVDIALPDLVGAGAITGALVAPVDGDSPSGSVLLESIDGGDTARIDRASGIQLFYSGKRGGELSELRTEGPARFEFNDLAPGRYRLSVLADDGRRYEPESIEVRPPATVEFRTEQTAGSQDGLQYSLALRDGRTGSLLDEPVWLHNRRPFWWSSIDHGDPLAELSELGEHAPVTLVVGHAGYLPACIDLRDAYRSARREGAEVEVSIHLEPGLGAALVVLDAEHNEAGFATFGSLGSMRGLSGARVVAGGRVIGTSDERGLALCAGGGPIEDFDVELAGWTVLAVQRFAGHSKTPDGLGFVLMMRE